MIITFMRSSMLGTYKWCPHKAFGEYVLGIKGPGNKKAEKGNIIHKVMECLAHIKKCQQDGKTQFFSDGIGNTTLEEATIERLLLLAYEYYKSQSIHSWTEKDFKECKKWVDKALEFSGGMFDPRNQNILEAEKIFDIEINTDWSSYEYRLPDGTEIKGKLRIKGTIDLIVNDSDSVLEIVDYKTGKKLDWATEKNKDFTSLCKDEQLLLYYYAAKNLFPEKEIIITIFYINDGGPYTIPMDENSYKAAEFMIKNRFNEIKSVLIPRRDITWKCNKLCQLGQTIAPNTCITMCEFLHREILKKGIGKVSIEHKVPGFDPTSYGSGGGRNNDKNN